MLGGLVRDKLAGRGDATGLPRAPLGAARDADHSQQADDDSR